MTLKDELRRFLKKTSNALANSGRQFRFGKTENQLSIFTADFAMLVVSSSGLPTRWF
jgi:hypothetical protein